MECCDICGDIGVGDALITCSQCKRNTQHMYCMRILLEEHVNDWICEECSKSKSPSSFLLEELTELSKINSLEVRKGGELPAESRKLPNESRVGAGDWEKIVATGKTKYISVNEAMKLSSGEKLPFLTSSNISKIPSHRSRMGKLDSAIRPRKVLPDFSSHQTLASRPLRPPKPRRPANVEIHKKQLQQSKLTGFRSLSSLRPSEALKDTHLVKEKPSEVQLPVTARAVKQSSLPSANTSLVAISGGDGHHNAIGQTTSGADNISKICLLDSEKYLLVPSLDALWKGSFRILGDRARKEVNHLVQAYPPSRVRKKIYEFSKKMPEVLQFKLVPSKPFWNNLFNEYVPDRSDIALYFFPGVGESSEEDYIFLVDQVISTNFALREQIADVELLVFSSKLLHADCQRWDGKFFLWGVFHRLKRPATMCSENTALESPVQPSDGVNHDQSQVHDGEEVDMDIDMISGINVGRIDVPVKKDPPVAVALPGSDLQVASGLRVAPVATIPSPNVKVDPNVLIPPGFEEVFRLRIQSSSSPVVGTGKVDVDKG